MTKIGVILSGCGVFDGSEIHEAVATMLALERAGVKYKCIAPDIEQMHVIDHYSGAVAPGERRNVLIESARIARGDILRMSDVRLSDYDGLMFPGGFGAAKNLCDFAVNGSDCTVADPVARLVREAHEMRIPMAFVCISPVIVARLFGDKGVRLTIGDDADASAAVGRMGADHVECQIKELVVDEENLVISSPAYMKASNIADLFDDVTASASALLEMVRSRQAASKA